MYKFDSIVHTGLQQPLTFYSFCSSVNISGVVEEPPVAGQAGLPVAAIVGLGEGSMLSWAIEVALCVDRELEHIYGKHEDFLKKMLLPPS